MQNFNDKDSDQNLELNQQIPLSLPLKKSKVVVLLPSEYL